MSKKSNDPNVIAYDLLVESLAAHKSLPPEKRTSTPHPEFGQHLQLARQAPEKVREMTETLRAAREMTETLRAAREGKQAPTGAVTIPVNVQLGGDDSKQPPKTIGES